MPRREPPVFRNPAQTLSGYFDALGRNRRFHGGDLPTRAVAGAVAGAVRLAWDAGGGNALADAALEPDTSVLSRRYAVGADVAEAALSSVERWAAGEEEPTLEERGRMLGEAQATARAAWKAVGSAWESSRTAPAPGELDSLGDLDSLAGGVPFGTPERTRRTTLHAMEESGHAASRLVVRAMAAARSASAVARLVGLAWPWQTPATTTGEQWNQAKSLARDADQVARLASLVLFDLGEREIGVTRKAREFPAADARVLEVVRASLLRPAAPPSELALQRAMELLGAVRGGRYR